MSGTIQGKRNSLANQVYACVFAGHFCKIADYKSKIVWSSEDIHHPVIVLAVQAIRVQGQMEHADATA